MADYRRVPMTRLISRLGLSEFHNVGPLTEHKFSPSRVTLPLKQHAGAPAVPVVKTGQPVNAGRSAGRPRRGQTRRAHPCQHRGIVRLTHDSVVIDA